MEDYTSDSSDAESLCTLDYSYLMLDADTLHHTVSQFAESEKNSAEHIETLLLHHNGLGSIPLNINMFYNLQSLDLSSNSLTRIPDVITELSLKSLIIKNNHLDDNSFPKSVGSLINLKELNLSGNNISTFPEQILEITTLKYLYLGGNHLSEISKDIGRLTNLQILFLGGNFITEVPAAVGTLKLLQALVLSDNLLESLPASIANLKNLKSLLLHKNRLRTLPTDIIALKNLTELSLRENPLVVRFVSDMSLNPPSLLEHAGRVIKINSIPYGPEDIPRTLIEYLQSAHTCVNPRCKGVFFDNRVEHIKFVDFCGKYRIPLLQYLCSSKCIVGNKSHVEEVGASGHANDNMMKKVLLG